MPWNVSKLDQPLKPDKGLRGGSCNRQACQDPGANHFNRSTKAWYCGLCAAEINCHNRDYTRNGRPALLCVPADVIDSDPSQMEWGKR